MRKFSRDKSVEFKRIDYYKNSRVTYVITCQFCKLINNYQFTSIEFHPETPNLNSIINDLKAVFSDAVILQKSNNCIIFDANKVQARFI